MKSWAIPKDPLVEAGIKGYLGGFDFYEFRKRRTDSLLYDLRETVKELIDNRRRAHGERSLRVKILRGGRNGKHKYKRKQRLCPENGQGA